MFNTRQWIPIAGLLVTIGVCIYMVGQLAV